MSPSLITEPCLKGAAANLGITQEQKQDGPLNV